jgi:hypothetical protein
MIGLWLNGIKPWGRGCGKHILEREGSNVGTIHEEGQAFHDDFHSTFRLGDGASGPGFKIKDQDSKDVD